MNHFPAEGWAEIARLQKSRVAATSEVAVHALELMIDRQINCIAAGHAQSDDPVESRRAVTTAMRRERHRARLVRLYLVEPISAFTPETICASRQALNVIFAQISPKNAALLLRVGQGGSPHGSGLSAAAARKCLSRLRARFAHLSLQAA